MLLHTITVCLITFLAEMVRIDGENFVAEGGRVLLMCLREEDDEPPTRAPLWTKDSSGGLPDHVILV